MGALLVLDISNNSIGRRSRDGDGRAPWIATPEGPQAIAEAVQSHVRDVMYDISMHMTSANICHDKGALTSLNLSSNYLKAEGGKFVAETIKVNDYAIAVILEPVSCPSDHWLNCCCLLLSTGYEGNNLS
jgi:hypothetical protein